MRRGVFTYVLITFLANTTLGNFNNEQDKDIQAHTALNDAAVLRRPRHVELATETTLKHVLDTIALSYPDLKAVKGQSMDKLKEQIRRKLRQYMKKKRHQKQINRENNLN